MLSYIDATRLVGPLSSGPTKHAQRLSFSPILIYFSRQVTILKEQDYRTSVKKRELPTNFLIKEPPATLKKEKEKLLKLIYKTRETW